LSRTALVAATAIFVTLPAIQTIQKVKDDVSNDRGAEQYAVQLLDSVPPDGVLIAGDYSTIFTAWWLRSIMGSRPDVGLLFRGQINRAWHRRRAASARVGLGPRLKHYPKSFITPDVRWELGVKLDELGPLRTRLKPLGLTASVTRQAITVRTQSQAFKVFQGTSFAGKRFAALLHVHFLTQLMVSGATAQVLKWHLQELTTLAGSDPLVGTLRARLNDYLRDGRATGP